MSDGAGTLDGLLRHWARERPNEPALSCPSNRGSFAPGEARGLSFAELDAAVERMAQGLRALEREPHQLIALHLPNCSESIIALLAVQRAGHVACLLPLQLSVAEIVSALNYAAVSGAIGMGAGAEGSEILRRAALDAPGLRHILAFGPSVPSGVIAIDRDLDEIAEDGEPGPLPEPLPDAPALITWSTGAGESIPIRRTHAELAAAGQEVASSAALATGDILLSTLLGSSIAGIGSGIAATLSAGAALVLHHPFERDVLRADIRTHGTTHLVLPGPGLLALHEDGALDGVRLRMAIAVWKEGQAADPDPLLGGPDVVDVRAFGEIGLVAKARVI